MRALIAAFAVATLLAACAVQPVSVHNEQFAGAPVTPVVVQAVDANSAIDPAKLSSFQPFRRFGKGQGDGYARVYRPRTKEEFVAMLRSPAFMRKESRVACEVIVRQMAEANPDLALPFEGCEGAAAAILGDPAFAIEECRDDLFRGTRLSVTNAKGSVFGFAHRGKCYKDEVVLAYKGRPIISLTCLNVFVPFLVATPVPVPGPPSRASACPEGFSLTVNLWALDTLPAAKQEEALRDVGLARAADSRWATYMPAYNHRADRFSRGMGDWLIEKFGNRAPFDFDVHVVYLDPWSLSLVRDLGVVHVALGSAKVPLPDYPPKVLVVIYVPPFIAGKRVLSPTVSGGRPQIWLLPEQRYPHEDWFRPGEKNPCRKDVHVLIPSA